MENVVAPRRYKVVCTYANWDHLSKAVSEARKSAKTITVQREALNRLMQDHSEFITGNREFLAGDL